MFGDIGDLSVQAPSFDDPKSIMTLGVDASWIKLNALHARIQPLFDFWALVKGAPPPINCIGHHEGYVFPDLPGLKAAHALFCGLNRPIDASHNGDDVYVFVTLPKVLYGSVQSMVCQAKTRPVPKNAVFTCYVRRYQEETAEGFSGRILSWELVKADASDPTLPQDWRERYQTERWIVR